VVLQVLARALKGYVQTTVVRREVSRHRGGANAVGGTPLHEVGGVCVYVCVCVQGGGCRYGWVICTCMCVIVYVCNLQTFVSCTCGMHHVHTMPGRVIVLPLV